MQSPDNLWSRKHTMCWMHPGCPDTTSTHSLYKLRLLHYLMCSQYVHSYESNTGSCIILCVVNTYTVMSVGWNLTLSIHVHSYCMLLWIIVSEQFLMHGVWYLDTCSIGWFKHVLNFFFSMWGSPRSWSQLTLEATWSKTGPGIPRATWWRHA